MIALVCRSHPEPTQTFHRRMAAALAARGVDAVRVALRRSPHVDAMPVGSAGGAETAGTTVFLRESGGRALPSFARHPLRSLALLVGLVLRARSRDKEGGRLGAVGAWRDGLALADWARRRAGPRRIDRFHAQFASWEASAASVAARLVGVPFSFEVHNPYTLVCGRAGLAAKVRAADVVTAISDEARRRVVALAPEAEARVVVVRCGVDTSAHARPRAGSLASGSSAYDVVAVGSLVPRKGHDVLVRAAARLAQSGRRVRVAIVGEGPERARLETLIAEHSAPVVLLGQRSEADALAIAAAATVATLACVTAPDGDEDGVPVALLEAMAAGVPVVSTTVSGIPDLLDEGRAGLLVPAGDPVGLATAIGRLLDDAALRRRLGEAGRARVAARHDLAACAADLASVLGASPRA